MPITHIRGPGFGSWLCFQFQLSALHTLGGNKVMTQVVGSLSPIWEIQTEFWTPSFGFNKFWILHVLGKWASEWKLFVSGSLYRKIQTKPSKTSLGFQLASHKSWIWTWTVWLQWLSMPAEPRVPVLPYLFDIFVLFSKSMKLFFAAIFPSDFIFLLPKDENRFICV